LPLPLDAKKWSINSCCCKHICTGCAYTNFVRRDPHNCLLVASRHVMCCACCGKAEGDKITDDEIKLKLCTACNLVKYCSVECQKNHWPQHEKACKKKAAEIREDRLFTQPDESYPGECPICCLPLPIDVTKRSLNSCCCKYICDGCEYANKKREKEQRLKLRCPYCREQLPVTDEDIDKNYTKRAKANSSNGREVLSSVGH